VTANVAADYKTEVASGGSLELNVAYSYTGSFFAAPDNFSAAQQGGYGIINASGAWNSPHAKTFVKIWGNNLANKLYATSIIEAPPGVARTQGAPRTYGVTAGYRF
jgi:iron complex outermembrane receptor protein